MPLIRTAAMLAVALSMSTPSLADSTWDDLKPHVVGDANMIAAPEIVALDAPYRTFDDPRTDIGARITVPMGEFIRRVTLVIDENPMPVSAVFELTEPQRTFAFSGTMRINGPTPVRVIAETDGGKHYMHETFVKTSGTGACAAPPGTDPIIAMQSLGGMTFKLLPDLLGEQVASLGSRAMESSAGRARMAVLDIDHPSHSGMQKDQITLLFIPMRYVETVEIRADDKPVFTMTGSISFSENPAIRFEIPDDATSVGATMTDTDGATFEKSFALPGG